MTVTPGSGQFEITENRTVVASGRISIPPLAITSDAAAAAAAADDDDDVARQVIEPLPLNSDDVYKELRLRGYDYGPAFRGIHSANVTGRLRFIGLL